MIGSLNGSEAPANKMILGVGMNRTLDLRGQYHINHLVFKTMIKHSHSNTKIVPAPAAVD